MPYEVGTFVNRSEMIRLVARKAGVSAADADNVVTAFLDAIALSLSCGDEVNLRKFGKFLPRTRKAGIRRNPKTGEEHDVPERATVGFIPSPSLKDRLNGD